MVRLRARFALMALAGLVLVAGCGGGDDDPEPGSPDAAAPADVTLRGACDPAERLGGFQVQVFASESSVSGTINDGVAPQSVPVLLMTAGDCRLLGPPQLFCDPPCEAGQTCAGESTCIATPRGQDVGVVSVFGLSDDVEMSPRAPGNNYFDTSLAHPGVEPDSVVHVVSTAGQLGVLSLFGVGSESIAPAADDLVLAEGQATTVTWTAPTGEAVARVFLALSIDQHGTTPTEVVCDFADSGSAVVPATLVDALINAGVSGFPNAALSRVTEDSMAVTGGCVDFSVGSRRSVRVSVDGHTPCMFPGQCPDGQTCDTEAQTCVPE